MAEKEKPSEKEIEASIEVSQKILRFVTRDELFVILSVYQTVLDRLEEEEKANVERR